MQKKLKKHFERELLLELVKWKREKNAKIHRDNIWRFISGISIIFSLQNLIFRDLHWKIRHNFLSIQKLIKIDVSYLQLACQWRNGIQMNWKLYVVLTNGFNKGSVVNNMVFS